MSNSTGRNLAEWSLEARPLPPSVRLSRTAKVDNREMKYLLQLPRLSGGIVNGVKYPVILFLHGSGGHNYIDELLDNKHEDGLLQDHVAKSYEFPFFVIGPRIPDGIRGWHNVEDLVIKALDDVIDQFPVDTDRIYLAGFSMGGAGTFRLAINNPTRFAALAPSAGRVDIEQLHKIAHIPIWIFHSKNDQAMPYENAHQAVTKLQELGANVIFTVYPGGHSLETTIYAEGTFSWLLKQKKRSS